MAARLAPLEPPYEPSTGDLLAKMMPPGRPPIGLFRTFARNPTMTEAMHGWGSYLLSRRLSVSMREREIVIDRVCARCGCEYEWGVHVAYFAARVGLTPDQIASLTYGRPDDPCWTEPHEGALIAAVDALHQRADLDDEQFVALRERYDDAAILDLVLLAGWYHAISFVARTAAVAFEPDTPRFEDYRPLVTSPVRPPGSPG
jgi:alkylhydroperoxidase family enzyme